MLKRFLSVLLATSAALLLGGGAVCGAVDSGSDISLGQSTNKKKKSKKKKQKFINIRALHASLPGSVLDNSGVLLFTLKGCEVYVLADENEDVRFMLVRLLKTDGKGRKKDNPLQDVCTDLQNYYGKAGLVGTLKDEDSKTALLHFEPYEDYGDEDKSALGKDRVTAIYDVMQTYTEEETLPKLALSPGYSVAFIVQKDDIEFNLALDLSEPTVEYAEVRYIKMLKKSLSTKYNQVAEDLWPGLSFSGRKSSVDGKTNFKILGTDGPFWMGRKDAFFIFATEERLRQAAVQGVNVKKCGFSRADFAKAEITLPPPNEVDWKKLTQAPEEEEEPEVEPQEEEPTPEPEVKPEPQPEVQPEPTPAEPTPEPPAQPAPPPVETYTPEAARRAFIDQLRAL